MLEDSKTSVSKMCYARLCVARSLESSRHKSDKDVEVGSIVRRLSSMRILKATDCSLQTLVFFWNEFVEQPRAL